MRIIPAIDTIDGKCVRLAEGDFSRKVVYNHDPVEVAKTFEGAGLKYLHLVDLDGARAGQVRNWRVLERIAAQTALQIDFSGGLKTDDDLRLAMECGAAQLTIGSVAVKAPELLETWLATYGPEIIQLSADVRVGKVAVAGWQEQTPLELVPFLQRWQSMGIQYAICTDIGMDGLLQGPGLELYRTICKELPSLKLVASGGVRGIEDLEELRQMGLDGAIVGKALYEGHVSPEQLAAFSELC